MRLLTWNIQWGRGLDGRVDLPRIVDAIRKQDGRWVVVTSKGLIVAR